MRYIIFFILNILFSFSLELFLPWWAIGISSFVLTYILFPKYIYVLILSFFSIFFYWGGFAFYLSYENQHLLLKTMSNYWHCAIYTPILVTACIGGIISLTASSTAYWIKYLVLIIHHKRMRATKTNATPIQS